jgi:spermidine synthase
MPGPRGGRAGPWIELGRGHLPDGHEFVLRKRSGSFEIRLDGRELMSTRAHDSEEAMARLACGRLTVHDGPHVLVGGLGSIRFGRRSIA